MTPQDLARIHALCFEAPRPWSAAEFTGFLSSARVFLLTEPGGFLMGRVIVDEAEILTLAVDPPYRRQGCATRLVAAFLAEAAQRGASSAFLEVSAANAAAQALYRAAGFCESGRRPSYYTRTDGTAEDAILMTAGLAGRIAAPGSQKI